MTRTEAVEAVLVLEDPGQMSMAIWEGLGLPFKQLLLFTRLPEERAHKALRGIKVRAQAIVAHRTNYFPRNTLTS